MDWLLENKRATCGAARALTQSTRPGLSRGTSHSPKFGTRETHVGTGPTAGVREGRRKKFMVEMPQPAVVTARARTHARRPRPARLVFVDGLRLLAAFQMVQGHTLDALLAEELRHGAWFRAWTFARGLTSVAFLFTAGLAFALATATASGLAAGRARRLARAGKLITLGYLMHAPLGVLFGDDWGAALRQALAVDVLQCIGVCLLVLELAALLVRGRVGRALVGVCVGTLCFALGPWSEGIAVRGPWLPALHYASAQAGSLFPLLPWAGYLFFGLAVGQVVAPREPEAGIVLDACGRVLGLRLLGLGLAACALAWLLFTFAPASLARVSPAYATLKLGLVLGVAAALATWLEGKELPPLLRRLSSETLFLYVSHVLVLYAGHLGLAVWLGRSQSLPGALVWTLLLLVGCGAGALGYRRAQRALRGEGQRGTPRPQPSSFPG